jgi:hypothetical protein
VKITSHPLCSVLVLLSFSSSSYFVLKKFFTACRGYENNMATRTENAMKYAVKTLLTHTPRGAVEDAVGLVALFVLMFAVLAMPGLA